MKIFSRNYDNLGSTPTCLIKTIVFNSKESFVCPMQLSGIFWGAKGKF